MNRLLRWLLAITFLIALVLFLRYFLLSRIFYQPDWYQEQQAAGESWKSPARSADWSPEDALQPGAKADRPAEQDERAPAQGSHRPEQTLSSDSYEETGPTTRLPEMTAPSAELKSPGLAYPSKESETRGRISSEIPHSTSRKLTPLQKALQQEGQVRIAADALVPTILAEMAGQDGFDPYTIVRGAKTTIHPQQLIIEMIVNLENIPMEQLTQDGARVIQQLRKMLPAKVLQQVYIKGDLRPAASGKHIVLGSASTISVGRITLDLDDIKNRFQIDPAINMSHFAFSRFELREGYLLLQQ